MSTQQAMELTRALQDYLKAIYILQVLEKKKIVRIRDIANFLSVKMPSVTDAMKKLSSAGLIVYNKRNYIELSPVGEEIAKELYKKWEVIYLFLKNILGVSKNTAQRDACKIEHIISKETYDAIKKHLKKMS